MTLKEQGKRLPTLAEYAELLLPLEHKNDLERSNQYGAVADPNDKTVSAVQTSGDGYRLMPSPEFSPRLYRGQNTFYEICRPSMSRLRRKADRLFWRVKTLELFEILQWHPACQDLFGHMIEGLNFDFNFEVLAQHYGYPTTYMDFSRSKDVAMFFATCAYNEVSDTYAPLSSGNAALYTADFKAMLKCDVSLKPLGLEPLPNPEAQSAFAVNLTNGNLNDAPWVKCERINISSRLSRKYFDLFDGGEKLFPKNPFDELIQTIRRTMSVPRSCLTIKWSRTSSESEKNAAILEGAGYAVSDTCPTPDDDLIAAAELEWQTRKADYFSRIRIRGVSDHLVTQ